MNLDELNTFESNKSNIKAETFSIKIPNTTLSIKFIPIKLKNVDKEEYIWISEKEVSWELYDALVFKQDRPKDETLDAIARPTKPYMTADRGWGHNGYPVISVSPKGAAALAKWLTKISAKQIRIPKMNEWIAIWNAGNIDLRNWKKHGWCKENSQNKTQPCGKMAPDKNGVYDMLGNVGEWCLDEQNHPILIGGSWKNSYKKSGPNSKLKPEKSWNATDPQLPKSIWWLADASWAGIRLVYTPNNENLPLKKKEQVNEQK